MYSHKKIFFLEKYFLNKTKIRTVQERNMLCLYYIIKNNIPDRYNKLYIKIY